MSMFPPVSAPGAPRCQNHFSEPRHSVMPVKHALYCLTGLRFCRQGQRATVQGQRATVQGLRKSASSVLHQTVLQKSSTEDTWVHPCILVPVQHRFVGAWNSIPEFSIFHLKSAFMNLCKIVDAIAFARCYVT